MFRIRCQLGESLVGGDEPGRGQGHFPSVDLEGCCTRCNHVLDPVGLPPYTTKTYPLSARWASSGILYVFLDDLPVCLRTGHLPFFRARGLKTRLLT